MKSNLSHILIINGGSSSIKFAICEIGESLRRIHDGVIEHLDQRHHSSSDALFASLEKHPAFASVKAVGHRVVHGMKHSEPEKITPELLDELRGIIPYDPDHLPLEIELIEAFLKRHPDLPQVACFDTAFHRAMPRVAKILPIPRRYENEGVERYGFHGLSYTYLMSELTRLDENASKGKIILAHLGNGASLAAVRDGKSVDTSMGFTPASGLMMGSRSGDLDPGLIDYFARTEKMTTEEFHNMVNHESGLLGVSGISSDVRDLLARESEDAAAAEAIALFCYQTKKWLGSFAAALGGLDTLVFSGGIGENSPVIRRRICEGLDFLGIELDETRNNENAPVISTGAATVSVRVIHTDEESVIAQSVIKVLNLKMET